MRDRGFLYDSSLMDTDHPYELTVDGDGSLVEIPIQWALDDWEQYCYVPDFSGTGLIERPVKAIEMWQLEFDAMRAVGGCFVLTNHPFLSGRPSRANALDGLIEYVCSHDDVWVTSLGPSRSMSAVSTWYPAPSRGPTRETSRVTARGTARNPSCAP